MRAWQMLHKNGRALLVAMTLFQMRLGKTSRQQTVRLRAAGMVCSPSVVCWLPSQKTVCKWQPNPVLFLVRRFLFDLIGLLGRAKHDVQSR